MLGNNDKIIKIMKKQDKNKILNKFLNKLITNQKDIPEDIQRIVNEHYRELLKK